jgi:excisionase family DNA binding protein
MPRLETTTSRSDGADMDVSGPRARATVRTGEAVVGAPRLALTIEEAAEAIGVSRRHFERHIIGHLRVAAVGGRRLIPVRELERFLVERAT